LHKANEKSKDVKCEKCSCQIQIKAKKHKTTKKEITSLQLLGAEYKTTCSSIKEQNVHYLILLYSVTDKNIYTIEFESFWKSYDKPAGKANAFKVWKSIKPDSELQATILQKATLQAKNVERKFRKDAERWLRDRRWEDEISVVKQVSNFDEMMRSAK
jgi:hypothetical protein